MCKEDLYKKRSELSITTKQSSSSPTLNPVVFLPGYEWGVNQVFQRAYPLCGWQPLNTSAFFPCWRRLCRQVQIPAFCVGPLVNFYFHHRQNLGVAVMQPTLRIWGTSSSLQCQFFIQVCNIAQKPSWKISASGVCQQLATMCNLSFRYVPIARNNCIKTSQTAQSQLGLSFSTCCSNAYK